MSSKKRKKNSPSVFTEPPHKPFAWELPASEQPSDPEPKQIVITPETADPTAVEIKNADKDLQINKITFLHVLEIIGKATYAILSFLIALACAFFLGSLLNGRFHHRR